MNSTKKIREPTKARKAQEVNFIHDPSPFFAQHWYQYNTRQVAPLDYPEADHITVKALGLSHDS
jgi:hypothetical protein